MSTIELKLKPWFAPNYAIIESMPGRREDGLKALPTIHVSELSQEALRSLAEQWLTDLYAKAEKQPDWTFHPARTALKEKNNASDRA